eukprot:1655695-Pyramimonas_sp.AAC.1
MEGRRQRALPRDGRAHCRQDEAALRTGPAHTLQCHSLRGQHATIAATQIRRELHADLHEQWGPSTTR